MQTLALSILALAGLGQDATLPQEVALADFSGIEARSFEDLFGRAVLIEFFAHWCAPCARQVPHLNDLQKRYGEHGLVVLGVTGDAPEDAEPWVAQHGMAFPYAYDPQVRLQIDLGFNPLPFAILLDTTGTIVWSGKADQLDEATLEKSLGQALSQPVWTWPAGASELRGALAKNEYAVALRAAAALEDAELGSEVTDLITRRLERRAEIAEAALASGDLMTSHDIASGLAVATAGEEIQARFARLLEKIDQANDGLLEAQQELRALWRTVHEISSKAAADELSAEILGFSESFPDEALIAQAARYQAALTNLRMSLR